MEVKTRGQARFQTDHGQRRKRHSPTPLGLQEERRGNFERKGTDTNCQFRENFVKATTNSMGGGDSMGGRVGEGKRVGKLPMKMFQSFHTKQDYTSTGC